MPLKMIRSMLVRGTTASPRSNEYKDLEKGLPRSPDSAGLRTEIVSEQTRSIELVQLKPVKTDRDAAPSRPSQPARPNPSAQDSSANTSSVSTRTRTSCITAYKVMFATVVSTNVAILLALAVYAAPRQLLTLSTTLLAVAVNLFLAVLMRQEELLNALYAVCTSLPRRTPFAMRKLLANFHHFGGLHSGCATSALAWYVAYVVLVMRSVLSNSTRWTALQIVDTATWFLVLVLLLFICIASLPSFRRRHHDSFERIHRFGGWAAIIALWIHAIISAISNKAHAPYKDGSLYLLAATTFLIILPWLRIRRIPVYPERMSAGEVQLSFQYKDMPSTSTMRFSTSPIMEWHAFATIPNGPAIASIVVSKSGDWTSGIIAKPPQHIWIRGPPTFNFLRCVRMFNRVLIIATGSGIGPVLSLLESTPSANPTTSPDSTTKVLWVAHKPSAPHWSFATRAIKTVDPEPQIIDSTVSGRPNLLGLTRELVDQHGIEAVFVVASKRATDSVVKGVRSWDGANGKRIMAFGATFDS